MNRGRHGVRPEGDGAVFSGGGARHDAAQASLGFEKQGRIGYATVGGQKVAVSQRRS